MIENKIYCLGLSRVEMQCIRSRFPLSFQFICFMPEDLDEKEKIRCIVSSGWCAFVNPKKISAEQLERLVFTHEMAVCHTHAALLIFTDSFTREQKCQLHTEELRRINLRSRFERPLRDVTNLVSKGTMPCWDHLNQIRANMFNDTWYLIDIETTGIDPLEDDILSIHIACMTDYKIKCEWKFYIRQTHPISEELEKEIGITNEMLEQGISKEEVVKLLREIPFPALIFESEKYVLPFIKAMFHLCGEKFDLPFVAIDGLAAIAFAYTGFRRVCDILEWNLERKNIRTPIDDPYMFKLYDITLTVFESLQERYDVYSPGQFPLLYAAEIRCCY